MTLSRSRAAALTAALATALFASAGGASVDPALAGRKLLCTLAPGQSKLPPDRVRGLAHHLRQYPDLALATPSERRAAATLLERVRRAAAGWGNAGLAHAAGFDTHLARRPAGDRTVGYLHAEHRRFSHDGRLLDPQRPESLIYVNVPGRPLVLVGMMFSVPRGRLGPTPGGPIDRWHSHLVCVRGDKRGLAPLADGTCPAGATRTQGSEMLHVWLTSDLRSAFAIHAPFRELCGDGVIPAATCRRGVTRAEM